MQLTIEEVIEYQGKRGAWVKVSTGAKLKFKLPDVIIPGYLYNILVRRHFLDKLSIQVRIHCDIVSLSPIRCVMRLTVAPFKLLCQSLFRLPKWGDSVCLK